jgi:hypothetical protein
MNRSLVSLAVALACGPAWPGDRPSQLPANVAACASIQDGAQRARCYDREVAALSKAPLPTSPAVAPESPPSFAVPAPPPPADFGVDSLNRKARTIPEPVAATLQATVSTVREAQPGLYVLTLDNGQVWSQSESRTGFELKAGDSVSIKKGTMGSYRLWGTASGSWNWVRVIRVR